MVPSAKKNTDYNKYQNNETDSSKLQMSHRLVLVCFHVERCKESLSKRVEQRTTESQSIWILAFKAGKAWACSLWNFGAQANSAELYILRSPIADRHRVGLLAHR